MLVSARRVCRLPRFRPVACSRSNASTPLSRMSILELTTLLGLLAAIIALTCSWAQDQASGPDAHGDRRARDRADARAAVHSSESGRCVLGLPSAHPLRRGWEYPVTRFLRNLTSISLLAFGLVVATMVVVAVVTHAVVPDMSWGVAFLIGAIVSPPYAAAATAICQRLGVSRNIVTVLEGESLVNDAAGLICFRVALAAIVSGSFEPAAAAANLVWVSIAGIAYGIAVGFVIAALNASEIRSSPRAFPSRPISRNFRQIISRFQACCPPWPPGSMWRGRVQAFSRPRLGWPRFPSGI